MDCTAARHAMLEADPADLAPGAGSDLARHLQGCPACRAQAAAILAAERALGEWLAAERPRAEAAEAVARAAAASRRRSRARRAGAAGSLLAAAAAVVALLLPHRASAPLEPAAALPENGQFSVTAAPGTNLVVMHTSNPKIIVVWYLPIRRTS